METTVKSRVLPSGGHQTPAMSTMRLGALSGTGAILTAKTTTPEFGHMPYTEAPLFGRTRNAWAADRTSGGSSGGAAVALAAGVCPIGIGTDAGGFKLGRDFFGIRHMLFRNRGEEHLHRRKPHREGASKMLN